MNTLLMAMTEYFRGDPKRVQHLLKVYTLAHWIGTEEGLDERTQYILDGAACVHDIGIREGERRFGRNDGAIQEELGPKEADTLLQRLGWDEEARQRICWLVGRHHQYEKIMDLDHQILIEADLLVNAWEDQLSAAACRQIGERHIRTKTGKRIWELLFSFASREALSRDKEKEQRDKKVRELMEKRRSMRNDWDRF